MFNYTFPLQDNLTLDSNFEHFKPATSCDKELAMKLNIKILTRKILDYNPYKHCASVTEEELRMFSQSEVLRDKVAMYPNAREIRIYRTTHLSNGTRIFACVTENIIENYLVLFTVDFDGYPTTKEQNICK